MYAPTVEHLDAATGSIERAEKAVDAGDPKRALGATIDALNSAIAAIYIIDTRREREDGD